MKTVIDAVKELKGELNGAAGVCYPEDSYLFYALDGSHYIFDECKDTDGVYQYVCTRKEFLATVAECETNFGRCDISFSEHCTNETIRITKSPIFTQEMADDGVSPSVGMECLINFPDIDNAWYKYTIDFMGKHTFIASCEDVSERFGHVDDVYFKLLTPSITLTDGECYQFDYHEGTFRGYFKLSHDRLYHSTGYYHESVCTNIQPLTVEKE
jgi:hypothetical protein